MIFNRKKIEQLNEEIKNLSVMVKNLTNENKAKAAEISHLKTKIGHLETENGVMKKTVTDLADHEQELIKKNQQLEVDLNEATETVARQMGTIYQLETKLDRLSTWKRRQRNEKGQFIRKEQ